MKAEYVPTPSQTVGPYLHIGLTRKHSITRMAGPEVAGEQLCLLCRVLDLDGKPVPDAMVEVWQADSNGNYNHPDDTRAPTRESAFYGFGRAATNESGACEFETIRPGRVPGPENTLQAPHLNLAVYARGILLQLYTRIYFAGDPANEHDCVLALVPAERRHTLIAQQSAEGTGKWIFDIHLRGDQETVFFDV